MPAPEVRVLCESASHRIASIASRPILHTPPTPTPLHLISPRIIPLHPIPFHPTPPYPILAASTPSRPISSRFVPSHNMPPDPIQPHPISTLTTDPFPSDSILFHPIPPIRSYYTVADPELVGSGVHHTMRKSYPPHHASSLSNMGGHVATLACGVERRTCGKIPR